MHLQENTIFADRYRLLRLIGRGGFSEVWLAEDTKTDLTLALKIFAPGFGLDDDGVRLFSREFSLVFNLNHSCLLRPTHYDVCSRMPYLIMPFCERGSATKLVGAISEREAWQLLHDVASGLAYLHEQETPVIHQDIKPDNILIDRNGRFLITDFGISSKVRSTLRKSAEMNQKTSGGTIAYMAPERFGRDNTPIKASDVWSLGATLFELMEGDTPFGEHGGLIHKGGAEIPGITGNYSQELKTIVEKCLAKDAWDRPKAEELVKWTEQYLGGGKIFQSEKPQSSALACPHCKSQNVKRIRWNWWGGMLGAAIVKEYKCESCKRTFKPSKTAVAPTNGNSGKMHGFVKFWLWLLIGLSGITTLIFVGISVESWLGILYALMFVVNVFAAILLLRKVKLGFWLFIATIVWGAIMDFTYMVGIPIIFVSEFISAGILLGILQIRRDGVSAWKLLRKPNLKKDLITFIVFAITLIVTVVIASSIYDTFNEDCDDYSYYETPAEDIQSFYPDDYSWRIDMPDDLKMEEKEINEDEWLYLDYAETFLVKIIREETSDLRTYSIYSLSSYASAAQSMEDATYTYEESTTINDLPAYIYRIDDANRKEAYIDADTYYYRIIVVCDYDYQKKHLDNILYSFEVL